MINILKKRINLFLINPLYKNSSFLMLNTLISAAVGFIFWIINTKIHNPNEIGYATALMSSMALISNLSLLGLNTGLIRYLPSEKDKNNFVNTVVTLLLLSTVTVSIIYVLSINYFSPKLNFLHDNIFYIIIFITSTVIFSLDNLISNIFISLRASKYILIKGILGNIAKIISPLVLLGIGIMGIYISAIMNSIVAFVVSIFILIKIYNIHYSFKLDFQVIRKIFKLSIVNYLASFLASLPFTLTPILIVNVLGPKESAIFYFDLMIINLLNTIQSSISQSMFAEGSNNDNNLKKLFLQALKLIITIQIPLILFIIFFGKYVLLIFGKVYSDEGIALLQLLALSVIFTSVNSLLSSIMNIKKEVIFILIMCIIGPAILLTLIYFALPYGLMQLGYAILCGEFLIAILYISITYLKYGKKT